MVELEPTQGNKTLWGLIIAAFVLMLLVVGLLSMGLMGGRGEGRGDASLLPATIQTMTVHHRSPTATTRFIAG
ncbi:MAG: hypothetical protein KY468_00415 [Armatimonadetes bacterium]|nr:hypothetical protein [Armatimonadota bacterium]